METVKLNPSYAIIVKNKDGSLAFSRLGENLVVAAGHILVAEFLSGNVVNAPSHLAVGASQQAAKLSETSLVNELARVSGTRTRDGNEITIATDFGGVFTQDQTVSEVGVFNAASAGTMFARFVEDPFTLFSDQNMTIRWSVRVGQ